MTKIISPQNKEKNQAIFTFKFRLQLFALVKK